MLKAALNGGRIDPFVPITPDALARDARDCIEAGAFAVHVHPRNRDGRESLEAVDVDAAVRTIRNGAQTLLSVPSHLVGVTTGAWIVPDAQTRRATIANWNVLPDFASVNMDEDGALEIARDLLLRGVDVEAGLSSAQAAHVYIASDLVGRCIRVLIEPQEPNLDDAMANVAGIIAMLDAHDRDTSRLLHGTAMTAWPMLRHAQSLGYQTRIGFEDVLVLPDGTGAASNRELILAARA